MVVYSVVVVKAIYEDEDVMWEVFCGSYGNEYSIEFGSEYVL